MTQPRAIPPRAPADAVMTDSANQRRCYTCDAYSWKVWGGSKDETQGKCFRDHAATGVIHWVDVLMTCSAWRPDLPTREKERQ